ncbi:hypothetical protein L228DRAFT_246454 [Xylona heveae TC161]|uniref:Copper-fist domain-containing protein n=1 Tax=Xylona heveae (strain CBS 132557 / TC161) TaxID=1328760 RepID=A0A165HK38_XYLHT|nr:hypothetical protein L228DRAFT_246454 [Xylona heveae TC161]KZF23633.1 hypothetical protein L228DRAFT_246454 [Xylona heveae TC161]
MPEILVSGKPRKFACEPCIRGHRSSKCQHHDRTLVEVRKPGRPLSTCPHVGSHCTCDRLRLALPRKSSCACGPTVSSTDAASSTPRFEATGEPGPAGEQRSVPALLSGAISSPHRVQKSSKRKTSAMVVVPESIARSNRSRAPTAPQQSSIVENLSCASRSPFQSGPPPNMPPNVPYSSNFAFSPTSTVDQQPPYSSLDPTMSATSRQSGQPPLRLGLTGSGGYPAIKDEVGWTGAWPSPYGESYSRPASTITEQQPKPAGGCCGPKRESSRPSAQSPLKARETSPSGFQVSTVPQAESHDHSLPSQQRTATSSESSSRSSSSLRSSNIRGEPYTFPSSYASSYQSIPSLPGIANGQHIPFLAEGPQHNFSPGAMNYPMQLNNSILESLGHDCNCGDACSCLACPTHPYNDTSVKFAESIYDFMVNENHYDGSDSDSPTGPVPESSAESACCSGNAMPRPPHQSPAELQGTVSAAQRPSEDAFASHSENLRSGSQATLPSMDGSEPQRASFDAINNFYGDEPQLINSPSLYYHLEYPLKVECSNEGGSCQCGEGCSCTGCFTHLGHTGVPLEPLAMPMFDSADLGMDMQNSEWQSSPFSSSAFSRL